MYDAHVSGSTHVMSFEKTCGAESVKAAPPATTPCRACYPARVASDRWIGRYLVVSRSAKMNTFLQPLSGATIPSGDLGTHLRGTHSRYK